MNGIALFGRTDEPDPARRAAAHEVVRLLRSRRPDLDVPFRVGTRDVTPLMLAAEAGALEMVRLLLDAGANPNATNGGRYTALDFAVDRPPAWSTFPPADRLAIVRLLLGAGVRTDRVGSDGLSPLVRARAAGSAQVVALLEQAEQATAVPLPMTVSGDG